MKGHKHLYISYKKKCHYITKSAKVTSIHNTIASSYNNTKSLHSEGGGKISSYST